MASEPTEEDSPGGPPESLDTWLRQHADELGVSRDELLAQLVGSYRVVAETDDVAAEFGALASVDDLDSRVDELAENLDRLDSTVSSLQETVDGLDPDWVAGELDEIDEKLTQMASAIVALNEEIHEDDAKDDRQEALAALKRKAAQAGVESAECESCEREVHLGLLTEPACPHCARELRDVASSPGWLFDGATVGSGRGGDTDEP